MADHYPIVLTFPSLPHGFLITSMEAEIAFCTALQRPVVRTEEFVKEVAPLILDVRCAHAMLLLKDKRVLREPSAIPTDPLSIYAMLRFLWNDNYTGNMRTLELWHGLPSKHKGGGGEFHVASKQEHDAVWQRLLETSSSATLLTDFNEGYGIPDVVLTCTLCSIQTGDLGACGTCKMVGYCCKEHQIQDWGKHKRLCKTITEIRCVILYGC